MKKTLSFVIIIALAIIAAGVLSFGCGSEESSNSGKDSSRASDESSGYSMPEFLLDTLDGGILSNEDLIGKPTVINFEASWCGPCAYEAPTIKKVSEEQTGVRFVGIAVRDDPEAQQQFVDKYGWNFTIALDSKGSVVTDFQQEVLMPRGAIPTTFFVDSEGKIFDWYIGPVTEADLNQLIAALIEADTAKNGGATTSTSTQSGVDAN